MENYIDGFGFVTIIGSDHCEVKVYKDNKENKIKVNSNLLCDVGAYGTGSQIYYEKGQIDIINPKSKPIEINEKHKNTLIEKLFQRSN